jgi:AcrR family transcriptional regulator
LETAVEENWNRNVKTKAKLIEAAGQVFYERGFRSATVREICRRAGTPLGAMNYHFRNKQGLYKAVLEHSYRLAIGKYPPHLGLGDAATPEEKLRAFIHSFLLRISDEGVPAWHMKLITREISDPTGALGNLVQGSIQPVYKYLVKILHEILRESDPAEGEESDLVFLCAMSIVGQCLYYFTDKRLIAILHPKSFNTTDIERIADHITRFSLLGIRQLSKGESK